MPFFFKIRCNSFNVFSKRAFDLVFSSLVIVFILSWMIPLFGLFIKISSKGPVLFVQKREGFKGNFFDCFKFRSMVLNSVSDTKMADDDDNRLTKFGKFLRLSTLDEMPQFINVFLGDMSIVGPRPQVYYYTDKYVGEQILILSVKPGITDLASLYFSDMDKILGDGDVDSKYEIEVEPIKNKLRLKYVKQRSLLLDIRIMIETAFTVFDIKNVTGLDIAE